MIQSEKQKKTERQLVKSYYQAFHKALSAKHLYFVFNTKNALESNNVRAYDRNVQCRR